MRIAIPDRFWLVNRQWCVQVDELPEGVNGECNFDDAVITLRPGMKKALREHTFLHELCHAIAQAMGWDRWNDDEARIDAVAGMLHQFLSTKKGAVTNGR